MEMKKLKESTMKELETMAKEMKISKWYGMKKDELIQAIEVKQTEESQTVEKPVIPNKPNSKTKKPCMLFNEINELVKEFESVPVLIKYALENKICNSGWIQHSLATGKRFYQGKDGKNTTPQTKNGFIGIGYRAEFKLKEQTV